MKRILLTTTLLLLAAPPAWAHKLKVFAAAEGAQIVGTAYFAGGGKAQNSAGRLLAADGLVVAEFHTGEDGAFRLGVSSRQDYRISIDSGDGHVAEAHVAAAELPESLPASGTTVAAPVQAVAAAQPAPATDAVELAVARQVLPLRQQIDALEERTRFSDIMGGIGTIFGICGLYAWIASRRNRKP